MQSEDAKDVGAQRKIQVTSYRLVTSTSLVPGNVEAKIIQRAKAALILSFNSKGLLLYCQQLEETRYCNFLK